MHPSEEEMGVDKGMQGLILDISHLYLVKCFYQLKGLGIHPRQIPILAILHGKDGCSQKEIAQQLGVKPPTVTVSIQRLEKTGLVCRKQDEKDQRVTRIYLTEKGREAIREGMAVMKRTEEEVFHNFSETEMCLLRRFLEQMLENIESMPGPSEDGCKLMPEIYEKEGQHV